MRCPADQNELRFHPCGNEGIHECGSCHGLWIGAAAQKVCFQAHQQASLSDAQVVKVAPAGGRDLSCPDCSHTPRLTVLKLSKIEIDRCPDCHGVWLDAGEFQAILDFKVKQSGIQPADIVGEGVAAVADPVIAEALLHVIEQAGEFSQEAAGAIAESIGEILGGLFSGL